MKKLFFIAVITGCLFFENVFSQNVGINTTGATPSDPRAMLEVRKAGFSKLKVRSENFLDTSVLELSNRNAGNLGTDLLFSLNREEGLLLSSISDLSGNIKDSLLSLRITSGNLGIGIKNPAYPMHLHTPSSGNSYMLFTNNTTGVSAFDGLLMGINGNSAIVANLENGNLRLGTNNLTRVMIDGSGNVGVGNLSPAYKLDVNGDLNLTGAMRIAGSAGSAGEVLVSNGAGLTPAWKDAAFGNNTRFGIALSNSTLGGGTLSISGTEYNLNPTDITIGANSITINKTGLYHFNGNYSGWVSSTTGVPTAPEFSLTMSFTGGLSYGHQLETWKVLPTRTATLTYYLRQQFSQDFYITAPATLQIFSLFIYSGAPIFTETQMNLFAYRISD